ncbi:hypothetical protein [Halorubrum ezzemoulense]|uniref:hypothetical protein n=1 Tax=Halorubrum ezzemoulense TaxID=337243 RepID=UPI002331034E|nr:hypothetical protein [Halorubrum ezzemoulense]MDB9252678.1 hypothetical protein [Halorubrum ezzemoulense]MDB9257201.1 hypothetical protein [Halorubrum ezzemoulense]MDB9277247.1 hypothetical protein [Halorubrum ezzemoulense]
MPSPEETTAAAREFLADHPEVEDALAALVERDARDEPWTFDDIDLDSGRFGELVARDLAREVDDGYRLRNPDAIRAAIDAGPADAGDATDASSTATAPTDAGPGASTGESAHDAAPSRFSTAVDLDGLTLLGLVGALLAVAGARLVAAPAVFREGFVVSPSNDTYFFRYWQERLVARADGAFDLGLFADMGGAAGTRPLAHATNWWVTALLGGADAAPAVAAWLPVVASACLGYLVYRTARLLTGDVRVALAAVLFYGLAPVNVVYTSVGFLDHQAHQYLWLGLLVATLTALGTDIARRTTSTDARTAARAHARDARMWAIALALAVAVPASAHAWGGSPLTFVPVAAVVGLRVALDVRHDRSPTFANAPLLGGLVVGAGLALAAHLALGWHESIAAVTPALVAGGALVVVGLGELWRRVSLPPLALVAAEAVVAVGGLVGYARLRPDDIDRLQTRADDLFFREGISETASLFSPDFAVVFGPLLQLGLGFYFAIAVLAVATWAVARRDEPGWLVLVCFAWYYTLLATIQVRFAGQLAIVIAPFAGIGLVYLLSAIDIARPVATLDRGEDADSPSTRGRPSRAGSNRAGADGEPSEGTAITSLALPDGTRLRGYLAATVALVLLFNLLLVPSLVAQTTHDRAQFDAALAVDSHAEAVDREYPRNFVLSQWGDNRMYNYFVSGESQSYGYARSNHDQFLASSDPGDWYDRFQGRVGYVVVTDRENAPTANTTYAALHEGLGLGVNDTVATGRYQLLASDDGVRTFAVVPGATIRVTDPAAVGATGGAVTATTEVAVEESGANVTHEYAREATVANGTATIRVAHPGEYRVGNATVTVTDDDVVAGNRTTVPAA